MLGKLKDKFKESDSTLFYVFGDATNVELEKDDLLVVIGTQEKLDDCRCEV